MVGTVDFLYTRGVNQFAERDLNLMPPSGISAGRRRARALRHARRDGGLLDPQPAGRGIRVRDSRLPTDPATGRTRSPSNSRSGSPAVRELSAAYTYTDAKNRTDSPGNSGRGNLGLSPLDGTWESPNLRTALWSRPHKLTLFGTADLPLKIRLGLSYFGYSGDPLTYIVHGDANADGLDNLDDSRNNDPVYVPLDAGDITLDDPAD